MKLCMDCAHFIHSSSACSRVSVPDYLRGHPQAIFATIERTSTRDNACGPEAKHFKVIPVAVAA